MNVPRPHKELLSITIGLVVGLVCSIMFASALWLAFAGLGALSAGLAVLIMRRMTGNSRPEIVQDLSVEHQSVLEPMTSLFFFNTLHNISALSLFNAEVASQTSEHLAQLVRIIADLRQKSTTLLSEELKTIDLYLTIEKARLGDRLLIEKDIDPACLEFQIPSLVLFPLVENAIVYGVENTTDPVHVKILCQRTDEHIRVELVDYCEVDDYNDPQMFEKRAKSVAQVYRILKKHLKKHVSLDRTTLAPGGERITLLFDDHETP